LKKPFEFCSVGFSSAVSVQLPLAPMRVLPIWLEDARFVAVDRLQRGNAREKISRQSPARCHRVTRSDRRNAVANQPRQSAEDVFRMLVTGGRPNFGGAGIPQRIMVNSRSAPALRTMGAG